MHTQAAIKFDVTVKLCAPVVVKIWLLRPFSSTDSYDFFSAYILLFLELFSLFAFFFSQSI